MSCHDTKAASDKRAMGERRFASPIYYRGDEITERAFKSAHAAFQGIMTPWNEGRGDYAFDPKALSRAVKIAQTTFDRQLAGLRRDEVRRRCRTWFAGRYDWDKDPEGLLEEHITSATRED